MKNILFKGNGKISLADFPVPELKDGQVLVKIKSAAICGSDMKKYFADKANPLVEGHENSGVVEDTKAAKWKKGDKVILYALSGCGTCEYCRTGNRMYCRKLGYVVGGFGEYVAVNSEDCLQLPECMSYDAGSVFCDCIALPFHTFKRLNVISGQYCLILGLGPVGLGMVTVGKALNLKLISADINDYRRKMAENLGSDWVFDPSHSDFEERLAEITKGKGVDIAIDCAGKEKTQIACMKLCGCGGSVGIVAGNISLSINPNELLLAKELRVTGNWYFNFHEYDNILKFIHGTVNPEMLITHKFPLEKADEAFKLFASGNCGKVVFNP